jgi:two-component system, NarL family, sensor histidine kinase UhpB
MSRAGSAAGMGSVAHSTPPRRQGVGWVALPMAGAGRACEARIVSLFRRVVAINAGVLVAAAILLALSPATVSPTLQLAEALVLAVGTVLMISVNLVLMRRVFGPLEQLTGLMRRVDPLAPGRRLVLERSDPEVAQLRDAFNAMLDRLEHERRNSGRRALAAQENERRRLARELHDEIGQTLTGVVLQLEALQRAAPDALQPSIVEAQETARSGVEDMREIARGLRPQALDEFGLRSALVSLAAQVSDRSGVRVRPQLTEKLPALAHEQDLAIYRVAQESLTNVVRHANARNVELSLSARRAGGVELRIRDDGGGIAGGAVNGDGTGLAGMRERALLIGGRLTIREADGGGTEVRLSVPTGDAA